MAADVGIKIQLEGEREYKQSLKEIISQQKEWSSEIRAVDSALDSEVSAQEKARKKADLLTKSIDSQQKKIGLMKDQLEKVEDVYGKDSEQAKKLRTQINQATTALNKMKSQAKANAEKMKDLGKSMKEAGEKMQKVGAAASKYISAPITAAAAMSVKSFLDMDKALDTVTTKTGATGQALQDMKDIATDIATTIPASFEDAAEAVGEVNTKFGLTGEALESLSTDFVKFSAITGQDVTSAVDGVQKAMAAFNMDANDAPKMLDAIAAAGQKTGISVDKLEQSLVKNAASLSQMGLNATDAVEFLGQLEMSGANADTVMSGLQKALTNAVANGKTLPEALADFQTVMNSTASEQDKLTEACKLFGKKAGPAIYEACKRGELDFNTLSGAAEDAAGTVDQTFDNLKEQEGAFELASNRFKSATATFGGAIAEAIAPAVDTLSGYIQTAGEKFAELDPEKQAIVVKAGAFAAGIWPITMALGKITSAAGDAIIKLGDLGLKAADVIATGGPVGLAIGALIGLSAAMIVARDKALASNETLQEVLTLTGDATTALTDATTALNDSIANAEKDFDDINTKAQTADQLITRLEELEGQSNKTTTEFNEMKTIVNELNTMYPGLNASIDDNTGALNKGTGEMRKYVEQARKMALIEAYTKASEEVTLELAKATVELTRARNAEAAATEDLAQLQANLDEAWENAPMNYVKMQKEADGAVEAASTALKTAEAGMIDYTTAVSDAQAAVDEATTKLDLYSQAQDELTAELGLGEDAAESAGDAMGELADATGEAADETETAVDEMQKAYQQLYDAAYSTISGGIGLFDEFTQEMEASTPQMIANLNTQEKAFTDYSQNLDTVLAWAATQTDENAAALVNALIDMGMDGADEMAALAQAIGDKSTDVDTILSTFGNIEGNKASIAGKVADFRSGIAGEFEGVSDDIDEESGEAATAAEEFGSDVASAAGTSKGEIADEAAELGDEFDRTRQQIGVQRALAKTEATGFGTSVTRALKDKVPSVKTAAQSLGDATQQAKLRITAQKALAQAAALAFGGAIVNALNSKKAAVTTAAGNMVAGGPGAIEGKASLYTSAGGKLGSAVGDGIKAKATTVQNAAASLAGSVSGASGSFSSAGQSLGNSAAAGVGSGFSGNSWRISSAVSGGTTYVTNQYSSYRSAGESLGQAIAVGISNKSWLVNQTASSLATSAANTINSTLKINSPAKVVIPSGEAIGEALEVGMRNRMGYVERAAAGLSRAAVPDVATGAGIAASRGTGADSIYSAVYAAVKAAAPNVVISEKSFKRALVGMGVNVA